MVKDPSVGDSTWNNGYFFQVILTPEISTIPIILWYSVRKSSISRKQDPMCLIDPEPGSPGFTLSAPLPK